MTEREKILEKVVLDTFWMARRYANGRKTYAPGMVNEALQKLESIGVVIGDDHTLVQDGNTSKRWLDEGTPSRETLVEFDFCGHGDDDDGC